MDDRNNYGYNQERHQDFKKIAIQSKYQWNKIYFDPCYMDMWQLKKNHKMSHV